MSINGYASSTDAIVMPAPQGVNNIFSDATQSEIETVDEVDEVDEVDIVGDAAASPVFLVCALLSHIS